MEIIGQNNEPLPKRVLWASNDYLKCFVISIEGRGSAVTTVIPTAHAQEWLVAVHTPHGTPGNRLVRVTPSLAVYKIHGNVFLFELGRFLILRLSLKIRKSIKAEQVRSCTRV